MSIFAIPIYRFQGVSPESLSLRELLNVAGALLFTSALGLPGNFIFKFELSNIQTDSSLGLTSTS